MGSKIFYTTPQNSRNLIPVPSTGQFGSIVSSTSSALDINEASKKVRIQQTNKKVPQGEFRIITKYDTNKVPYFVAEFQSGGKRRRRGSRSRKIRRGSRTSLRKDRQSRKRRY